jgi:hypothetical protein
MNSILGICTINDFNSPKFDNSVAYFTHSITQSKGYSYNFESLRIFIKASDDSEKLSFETEDLFVSYSGVIFPNIVPTSENSALEIEKLKQIAALLHLEASTIRSSLNGFYNLFSLHKHQQKLFIVNDAFGMHPLYYILNNNFFAFSTSYQSLVFLIKDNLVWDTQAFTDYLIWGNTLKNRTLMQDIKMLPPASKVDIDILSGDVSFSDKPTVVIACKHSLDEWASQYMFILKNKINLFLKWYPNIEITLTGGTDTRMIFAMMDEEERKKRKFITFSNPFMPDSENEDVVIAQEIARIFQVSHNVIFNRKYAVSIAEPEFFTEENKKPVLSGYLGSEALRFSPAYPNNIPELARFVLPASMEYDRVYDSFLNPKEYFFKSIPVRKVFRRIKPFVKSLSSVEHFSENELYETIRHFHVPYPEIAYMFTVLSRSFFSRINGGLIGSQLMPSELIRNVFSPFALPDLMQLSLGLHPRFLNSAADGATNHLLEFVPERLLQIPSNSHLADNTNTLLKRQMGLKHVTIYRSVNYNYCLRSDFREFVIEKTPFNYDKIFNSKSTNTNSTLHVWADILLFMKYVNELGTT